MTRSKISRFFSSLPIKKFNKYVLIIFVVVMGLYYILQENKKISPVSVIVSDSINTSKLLKNEQAGTITRNPKPLLNNTPPVILEINNFSDELSKCFSNNSVPKNIDDLISYLQEYFPSFKTIPDQDIFEFINSSGQKQRLLVDYFSSTENNSGRSDSTEPTYLKNWRRQIKLFDVLDDGLPELVPLEKKLSPRTSDQITEEDINSFLPLEGTSERKNMKLKKTYAIHFTEKIWLSVTKENDEFKELQFHNDSRHFYCENMDCICR